MEFGSKYKIYYNRLPRIIYTGKAGLGDAAKGN